MSLSAHLLQRAARFVLSSGLLLLLLTPGRCPAEPVTVAGVTEFTESGITVHCGGLQVAADGSGIWFDAQFEDVIGFFDLTTKRAAQYSIPRGTYPHNLLLGPDGNLWFTGLSDNIGVFNTTTKNATVYRNGITRGSVPHVLQFDPTNENFIWFTEEMGDRIARFDRTTQQVVEFNLGLRSRPHGLITGPDNRSFWMCFSGTDLIAKLDLSSPIASQEELTSRLTFYPGLPAGSAPHDCLFGPDGNLYITLEGSNAFARLNVTTGVYSVFPTTLSPFTRGRELQTLCVGPDDNSIWFNEFITGRVGKFDLTTEKITEYKVGISPYSGPVWMIRGPDNNIWFSEASLLLNGPNIPGRIARLVPAIADQYVSNPNRGFVATLYGDLLGRPDDPTALSYYSTMLDQGKANRFQVALAVARSQEAMIGAVHREYAEVLRRPATPSEVNAGVGFLRRGAQIDQLKEILMGSAEYFRTRGGETHDGFLAALYSDLLRRAPAPGDRFVYNLSLARLQLGPRRSASLLPGVPGQLGLERTPDRYPLTFTQAFAVEAPSASRNRGDIVTIEQLRQALAQGASRNGVAGALIFSEERTRLLLQQYLFRFLTGLGEDAVAQGIFVRAIQEGLPPDIAAAAIIASHEYLERRVIGKPLIPPGGIPEDVPAES